jgi:hypothetical protein
MLLQLLLLQNRQSPKLLQLLLLQNCQSPMLLQLLLLQNRQSPKLLQLLPRQNRQSLMPLQLLPQQNRKHPKTLCKSYKAASIRSFWNGWRLRRQKQLPTLSWEPRALRLSPPNNCESWRR